MLPHGRCCGSKYKLRWLHLSERERQVLELRFGLIDGKDHTLEEVSRYFNVTRERIRQIEAKALRKLSVIQRAAGICAIISHSFKLHSKHAALEQDPKQRVFIQKSVCYTKEYFARYRQTISLCTFSKLSSLGIR